MKKVSSFLIFFLASVNALAQETTETVVATSQQAAQTTGESTKIAMEHANAIMQNPAQELGKITTEQVSAFKAIVTSLLDYIFKYGFQVLGGLIILWIGWVIGGKIERFIVRLLSNKIPDITVTKFIGLIAKVTVIVFAGIAALSKFGIEIAPIIAGISVIGVGVSFALQGPLSNIACGITLVFTKPFKVGDVVEVSGVTGEVVDIMLPRTDIRALDGNMIIIPNRHIVGEIIHNYSQYKKMDLAFGVSYGSDMDQVQKIIEDIITADSRIAAEAKPPFIGIEEFGDSSVNFLVRLWCPQKEYLQLKLDLNKAVWDAFKEQHIEIPFPQRDVHLYKHDS